ncbi:beta-lactamase family protein [Streptomyces sp. Je 1-79]|uniref:serine hydrolase domain-containing protein n=1 Tax=Streptomyces sp. Je 1-79 TaxID=2943847 RepID=UPI0021A6484A|nr:serine hydrolase domain-containing protein [Streptomyces sp. Je 1-79]MCT4351995.1 beta-lactamase family protein [Streptomyces sp. Je 1-79]
MNADTTEKSPTALAEFVERTATELGIPGVTVGVWADGRETFANHGVTSLDNPLPVDEDTLFLLGSATKTFTATALMRLVADGRVELDAPVRRYVPELVLLDEKAAAEITVLHLLNHTSGLDWNIVVDTGDGDDALTAFVARMAELPLIGEPGARASYSQAGFNLLGRVLENVTGLTYERAVASLLTEPLGLSHSFFHTADVMTRRFAVGHNPDADGDLAVAREWKLTRANNPGGGLASSASDVLAWARFQLGDGLTENGERLLPAELLHGMREQTVELRGSNLGDGFGICWFLREVDGVRTIEHGGSVNGQFVELLLVPERNFAVVALSNSGPDGIPFNRTAVRWALEHYLGVVDKDPVPLPYDEARAREVAGVYENDVMVLTVATDGAELTLGAAIKPEIRGAADFEMPADYEPASMGLLPGDGDEFIVTAGGLEGQRGFFSRDARTSDGARDSQDSPDPRDAGGTIAGIDLGGRLFSRVPAASA